MKITNINNIGFGLKLSARANDLFEKSQDYLADEAIKVKNSNKVLGNNLNIQAIEAALNDDYILDGSSGDTPKTKDKYSFYLRNKNDKFNKALFLCRKDIKDVLNGKVWYEIAETLIKIEDRILR